MSSARQAPDRDRRHGWDPDYTGPERRGGVHVHHVTREDLADRYIARQFGQIEDRLTEGDSRMQSLEQQVLAMRTELARNTAKTDDIHDILVYARSGLKVLGGLGALVKWAGGIAAGVVAMWGLWHTMRNGGPKL